MSGQRRSSRANSDRPPPYVPIEDNARRSAPGLQGGIGQAPLNNGSGYSYYDNANTRFGSSVPNTAAGTRRPGERVTLLNPNLNYGSVESSQFRDSTAKLQTPGVFKIVIGSILFSWLIFFVFGYCLNVPLNSALHEQRRRSWDEEENYRAITRQAWDVEVKKHQDLQLRMQEEQVVFDKMQREWARQRQEEREERERRERQVREEEAHKRASISWEGLESGHCVRYGVKEYKATLSRVPLGLDSIQECQRKAMNIQGHDFYPSRCEEEGFCGRVTGHWEVDINESSCKPWWVNYKDKGCVEYGIRRHEASIEDLHDTENWESICMTTPMTIRGRHYNGPTSCANWGGRGLWPWGIWLLEDDSCKW